MKTHGWEIYLNGRHIDTVFYDDTTADEVKRSLVDHDGYNPSIEVYRDRKRNLDRIRARTRCGLGYALLAPL